MRLNWAAEARKFVDCKELSPFSPTLHGNRILLLRVRKWLLCFQPRFQRYVCKSVCIFQTLIWWCMENWCTASHLMSLRCLSTGTARPAHRWPFEYSKYWSTIEAAGAPICRLVTIVDFSLPWNSRSSFNFPILAPVFRMYLASAWISSVYNLVVLWVQSLHVKRLEKLCPCVDV